MRTKFVAGNWKMNLSLEQARTLASELVNMYANESQQTIPVMLAVPAPYLSEISRLVKHNPMFRVSSQNIHQEEKGAFTGEISCEMVLSCGGNSTLIGHSERRQYFGETNELLAKKIDRALSSGLTPVYCLGETLPERESGNTLQVVGSQLEGGTFHLDSVSFEKILVAYEPVWAIGTGKTATPAQAQEVHAFIRRKISEKYGKEVADKTLILYGGSVTAANAAELFSQEDIDGGLVGGASLKSREFMNIILSAESVAK